MRVAKAIGIGIAATFLVASAAGAATKIKKTELPEAVRQAVDRAAPAGHVIACWRNVGDRAGVYEVDLKVNGRKKGIVVSTDGEVLTVQDEITWNDLPEAVQQSFRREAGEHDVEEVNLLTQHGEVVGYIARIDGADRDYQFRVGADGEPPRKSETESHSGEGWRERTPTPTP
jgi:hypothetical protein